MNAPRTEFIRLERQFVAFDVAISILIVRPAIRTCSKNQPASF